MAKGKGIDHHNTRLWKGIFERLRRSAGSPSARNRVRSEISKKLRDNLMSYEKAGVRPRHAGVEAWYRLSGKSYNPRGSFTADGAEQMSQMIYVRTTSDKRFKSFVEINFVIYQHKILESLERGDVDLSHMREWWEVFKKVGKDLYTEEDRKNIEEALSGNNTVPRPYLDKSIDEAMGEIRGYVVPLIVSAFQKAYEDEVGSLLEEGLREVDRQLRRTRESLRNINKSLK